MSPSPDKREDLESQNVAFDEQPKSALPETAAQNPRLKAGLVLECWHDSVFGLKTDARCGGGRGLPASALTLPESRHPGADGVVGVP